MVIERKTPEIGLSIMSTGHKDWGTVLNQGSDLLDNAFIADRTRITALESTSAVLPLAIAKRIGHNLLRNNIFSQGLNTTPELPTFWLTQFLNGAVGNVSRTNQTYLAGSHSLRISIASVNTAPSFQTRPYPGLNILDPETDTVLSTTDPRQLTNGFGLAAQTVVLSPKTRYTLSGYGKSEIPQILGPNVINCHWKVGVVFKTATNTVIHSYFTSPQTNRTNNIATDSFLRTELTFVTPNLPAVTAEIWLVTEGSLPAGIGSSWFDGIQLEQASRATALDLFSMRGSDMFVDGNLTISGSLTLQQPQLFFESDKVTFTGDVQLGDNINEDTLEVFTKSSIFHGPLTVQGNTVLGDDAINDIVDVIANTTTFFNNQNPTTPQGGNVDIQGNLDVDGDVVLGSSSVLNTVTFNAQLVNAGNNFSIVNDLAVGGSLEVDRAVRLGSNQLLDTLVVQMSSGGSSFDGYVTLNNDLFVKGSTTLGNTSADTIVVNAGITTLHGSLQVDNALLVEGATTFNIGSGPSDNFSVIANDWSITATGNANIDTDLLEVSGSLSLGSGTIASITSLNTSFGTNSSPLNNYSVYASSSNFSGDLDIDGVLVVGDGINASGSSFIFGNAFSAIGNALAIGNPSAITGTTYNDQLNVYAGTTFFGDYSTQKKGNVRIGGSLLAAGDVTLGSSSVEDIININGTQVNMSVGTFGFKIGSGYQGNTYNPLVADHGGITIDNNGNLAMDGKLTVKGPFDPVQIIIQPLQADGYNVPNVITVTSPASNPVVTFNLTSSGTISAAESLILADGYAANINDTATTFGSTTASLASFAVHAQDASFSNDMDVAGGLSASSLSVGDADVQGNLNVDGSLVVTQSIVGSGTSFTFGGAPGLATTFNVKANDILLGIDGASIGNVTIGNNLSVRHDVDIGFPGQYDNFFNASAHTINFDVGSNKPGSLDLAGFRVGGGFQDNIYDALVLDHGGVTIDAYGNIFADGSIVAKGSVGFDTIELRVPLNGNVNNPVLSVIDNSEGYATINLTIDGYGNLNTEGCVTTPCLYVADTANIDGYLSLDGGNIAAAPSAPGLGALAPSKILFEIFQVDPSVLYSEYSYGATTYQTVSKRVLDIDNLGNIRTNGYIQTEIPGVSNLSTVAVTVGNGENTFGDFNATGPVNAYLSPIQAAIDYLVEHVIKGTIYVKSGTYPLPSAGLVVPEGISIIGDGYDTLLDGSLYYGLGELGISLYGQIALGITCGPNVTLRNFRMFNCQEGIRIDSASENCFVGNVIIVGSNFAVNVLGTKNFVKNINTIDCSVGVQISGNKNIVTENFATIANSGIGNVTISNIT